MMHDRLSALGRTLIIVNPAAQSGAAAEAAERLQRFLQLYSHRPNFDLRRTERPGHATDIAAEAAEYDTVLALGGDGVVREVACGLMRIEASERPTLGVVPVGSGNDFARTLGITDIADVRGTDFAPLLTSEPVAVDILKVSYKGATDEQARTTYAVETVSFGLDAAIAIDTQQLRVSTGLRGAPLYTASGLRCFGRGYRDFPVTVRVDDGPEQRLRTIVFAIQNGPTYGSGYHICPEADPSDGLLDLCYAAGPAPRAIALPIFLSAKNGNHVGNKRIHIQKARRVELAFPEPDYPIQVDGEQLHATELTVELVPQALTVLKPR